MKNFAVGLTLIELMVAISLTGILAAVGIAGYREFNRRQMVTQAARKIVQDLRLAQSLAMNNQKPSNCPSLEYYTVKFDLGSTLKSYEIFACCTNGCKELFTPTVTLPAGLGLSGLTEARFKVLSKGVALTGGSSLTITGWSRLKTITLGEGGEISLQ